MKPVHLAIAVLAVLAVTLFGLRACESEEDQLRKAFHEVVATVEKSGPINPLQIAARINHLSTFMAEDVRVDLGRIARPMTGWTAIQRYATLALQRAESIRVRIHGMDVIKQDDGSWSMQVVTETRIEVPGIWEAGFSEFSLIWVKPDEDWIIQSVEARSSIAHPMDDR